jgi:hypothetical protein
MDILWFREDTRSVGVGGVSIENEVGGVVIHGSMSLTPDMASLSQLSSLRKKLSELESALASVIEEGAFVEGQAVPVLETIENPFT